MPAYCNLNRSLGLGLACLFLAGAGALVRADEGDEPGGEGTIAPDFFERSRRLMEDAQRLGPWSEQARLINQANRHTFEQYGWNTEPDHFALRMITDVAEIPPWDFMGRFQRASTLIEKRYKLRPEQSAQVKQKVLLRSFKYMGRHAPTMFNMAEEFLAARLEGRAFSPEEVARWSNMAEPMLWDAQDELAKLRDDVEPLLDASQRELLARDLAADTRRAMRLMEKMEDWKRGKWRPEDWGLQEDPLHQASLGEPRAPGTTQPYVEESPSQASAYEPTDLDAWGRYVNDFINRYELDPEQITAARAILQDVRTQAGVHRSALESESIDSHLPRRLARIYENLFEELKRRIGQIPTEKQRQTATPVVSAEP